MGHPRQFRLPPRAAVTFRHIAFVRPRCSDNAEKKGPQGLYRPYQPRRPFKPSLKFESIIHLEHTPENAPDFRIEDYARLHPFSYAEGEFPDLAPYIRRHHPKDVGVDKWLAKFVTTSARRPTGQLLMTLNEAIAESFSYKRRTSPGTQTPEKTIETQQGTCRDFALLMMEAARSLGFAARFVTGYVYVPNRDGSVRLGGGATHAWAQIYVPGSGWVEFDPTNGIVGNRDLIRVGVARMPQQAIPLFGSYWGDAEDELGMEVTVNVKTENGSPARSTDVCGG
jgi:transglutaminase-like putative cysteine protease